MSKASSNPKLLDVAADTAACIHLGIKSHWHGMSQTPQTWAVILPAAGRSVRFGTGQSKLMADIGGKSVLARTLEVFMQRSDVAWIGLAVGPTGDDLRRVAESFDDRRIVLCEGGACRAQSVRRALEQVPDAIPWVGVHDAARPAASQGLIERVLAGAMEHGAAAPAMAVDLTIKLATGPLPARAERTLPRQHLWAMQTPQIMRRDDLLGAFERCPIPLEQVTDDVQLLELDGRPVWLVQGEARNIKITTVQDLTRLGEKCL